MRQIEMRATLDVACPAAALWAVLADYDRDVEWRAGVRAMRADPPGPAAIGTRTAELLRFAGRTLRNDGEVTTVGPGLAFTWRTTSGVDADGRRAVDETAAACRVHVEQRARLTGVDALGAPLVRRIMQHRLEADLRRLAALVTA